MWIHLDGLKLQSNDPRLKEKGAYAISFTLAQNTIITVGKMGALDFKAGHYFYVGSAYGPGGLGARIGRHILKEKKKHWHFDYIRPYGVLKHIDAFVGAQECHIVSQIIKDHPKSQFPHKKLGSQDCSSCVSHVIYMPSHKT